ncbi:TRAP transporter large permease, partial [Geomicrobium sp. JCM 19037]|uniref:TRAP transporter large permease n=1 Tax=Geomicrobium sp. JCM 19037 TaxID=1460634 RepID=UPI0005AB5E9C
MAPEIIGLIGIVLLFLLILMNVHVGLALILVGLGGYLVLAEPGAALAQLGRTPVSTAMSYSLSVIPMFIFMGMILSMSGFAQDLYRAVDKWGGHFTGGIGMSTIGASAVFSAISGSSSATTATMAKVALPEMKRYEYDPKVSTACVVAGGTLGALIPPSVVLILYGVLTGESVGQLLIGGILPGVLMTVLFMLTVYLIVKFSRDAEGKKSSRSSWRIRFSALQRTWPFLVIFLVSIGGIFLGWFTPTEAGGVGAMSSLIVATILGRFKMTQLLESLDESVRLTCMIFMIIIGATLFSQFLAISGIPSFVSEEIIRWGLNPYVVLAAILIALFILGMFMEGVSILVLTLPIIYPLVTGSGL